MTNIQAITKIKTYCEKLVQKVNQELNTNENADDDIPESKIAPAVEMVHKDLGEWFNRAIDHPNFVTKRDALSELDKNLNTHDVTEWQRQQLKHRIHTIHTQKSNYYDISLGFSMAEPLDQYNLYSIIYMAKINMINSVQHEASQVQK